MFDIGWQELFIVAVLAILVVGPRDLPRTLRTVMSYIRKAKSMARDFQNGIDEVAREVELDDIKREANKIGNIDLDKEIQENLDPDGSIQNDLDMADIQEAIQHSAEQMNKADDDDDIKILEDSTKPETLTSNETPANAEDFAEATPKEEPKKADG